MNLTLYIPLFLNLVNKPLFFIWFFDQVKKNVEEFVSLLGVWMKHGCA